MADIVGALGVGKGVFYWYFTSKDELLTESAQGVEPRPAQAPAARAIGDEADPVRRIELGIRATLEWFREHRDYFAIIQFAATDETFAPVLAAQREISIADTIRHLKDGDRQGAIRDGDPEMLAQAIHGVVGRARPAPTSSTGTSLSTTSPTCRGVLLKAWRLRRGVRLSRAW